MVNFDFDAVERSKLLSQLNSILEVYYSDTKAIRVSKDWDVQEIRKRVRKFSFDSRHTPEEILEHVTESLTKYAVHTPHPHYFGLFNPRPGFASIMADLISATYNPQLAAWSHSPFANEIEQFVIQEFGLKFGYAKEAISGTFCTGGAESNLTAVICALNHFYPSYNDDGVKSITCDVAIYASSESHHSIAKAAKMTGLGANAVRSIPVEKNLKMNVEYLRKQIHADRQAGIRPMLLVGTAGTTGAGTIDDLRKLKGIAQEEDLWFHVDAAYGGAAIASRNYASLLVGIEGSDSITLDLHKWFSVPMGASIFVTNHKSILHRSFRIKTKYMPEDGDPNQIVDPYVHSVQWSRRFIGLKIYLPLAIHGWEGYDEVISKHIELGELFRAKLSKAGWEVLNDTRLPVICFRHPKLENNEEVAAFVYRVNDSGKTWVSIYPIHEKSTVRVCFINYLTGEEELDMLMKLLGDSL